MNVLITLGDSWTQGAELKTPYLDAYPNLLYKQGSFDKLINPSQSGSSLEHLILQLNQAITEINPSDKVTVVCWFTNPARSIYWPKGMSWNWESQERSHWPPDALDSIKEFIIHFHEHDFMRASQVITTLQKICQDHGFDDYYLPGWIKYDNLLSSVNKEKIWKRGLETASVWLNASDHCGEHLINVKANPLFVPNHSHANEHGHKIIAEKLANWINR